MNKNVKIVISIFAVFIILISYTAYSEMSSLQSGSNIKPRMLSEKQILNLCHFHNYTDHLYFNSLNFTHQNNSYYAYSQLNVQHNTSYNYCFLFVDGLNIFNNKTDLNQCEQKLTNNTGLPFPKVKERWEGNVNFTFYACNNMFNSSFINSTYNECRNGATWFFAVNGTKLIDFFIPFNMFSTYTVFTNLAESLLINAKNITYSTFN